MENKAWVVERLGRLEQMRQAVRSMDEAMQLLTPEERLVLEMTIINPEKHAVDKLCQMLCVEKSAVYRRREKGLKKLVGVLSGEG